MSELFGRVVRLEVGEPGQAGRAWSNLHITATIKKTSRSRPNAATVTIRNLNKDSRGFLESKKPLAASLFGGYEDNPPLLFVGRVDKVSHEYSGTDWLTTIKARDGGAAFSKWLGQSWRGPLTSTDVIKRTAEKMGLKVASFPPGLEVVNFLDGFVAPGTGRQTLDELADAVGFEWSIQNGNLLLTLPGEPANPRIRLLQSGSGLIGSPEKTKRGVRFKVQLDGRLVPGDLVQLASKQVNGVYLVKTVAHSVDSHEGEFATTVEANPR